MVNKHYRDETLKCGGSFLFLLFAFGGATAAPRLDAQSQEVYANAYQSMTMGHAYDGAVQLIELLRSVPDNNIDLADAFVGPNGFL